MAYVFPKNIDGGFESVAHYEESMRDFTRVLDYLDRAENISEERKELYHRSLDEIGMDGVFELARNTNELFKELGINSYRLQLVEHGRKGGLIGGRISRDLGLGYHGLTPEEMSENSRKGVEARGHHLWSLEEIAEIGELKYGEGLTWNDTTSRMNEKYGENWTTGQVTMAYHQNKDLLPDEEE